MPKLAAALILLWLTPVIAADSLPCIQNPDRVKACPNLLYRVAQLPQMSTPGVICICATDFAHLLQQPADETEKVALLDAGANDYVTKPFSVQELMARIRVMLRNSLGQTIESVIFDDGILKIDFAQRQVFLANVLLSLTRKEFQLLMLLAQHRGQLLTQPHILKELWGPTHQQDTHYLRILVAKLRNKLNDDAIHPKYISTEPGVGLRFLA